MAKDAHYNATEHISAETAADPYLRPAFAASDRARRLVWNVCRALLYRPSPRPFHAWRAFLLRCFGAKMGPGCHFYPGFEGVGAVEPGVRGPGDGGGWRGDL